MTALLIFAALLLPPVPGERVAFTDDEKAKILRHSPLPPLPPDPTNRVADDPTAAHFGRFLYFDTRLSSNGKVSCATCHDPQKGYSDGKRLAEGVGVTTRNSPTVWNAAYNRWQFLDGRADTLWAQAAQPIENPKEMDFSRLELAHLIAERVDLRAAYEAIFGALPDLSDRTRFPPAARPLPDTPDHPHHRAWEAMRPEDQETATRILTNVTKCIAAYERRIISRDSPFDRFVAALRSGDERRQRDYPDAAKRGLRLFVGRANCRTCHTGPNFTDNEFHMIRVPPLDGGEPTDPGRYEGIAKLKADPLNALGVFSDQRTGPAAEKIEFLARKPDTWGQFKTPTLRNVAKTAPYMHQGQFVFLRRVLVHYSIFQDALPPDHHGARETILQPLNLTEGEIRDLMAFLETLTDESIDDRLKTAPESPRMIGAGVIR